MNPYRRLRERIVRDKAREERVRCYVNIITADLDKLPGPVTLSRRDK